MKLYFYVYDLLNHIITGAEPLPKRMFLCSGEHSRSATSQGVRTQQREYFVLGIMIGICTRSRPVRVAGVIKIELRVRGLERGHLQHYCTRDRIRYHGRRWQAAVVVGGTQQLHCNRRIQNQKEKRNLTTGC